MENATPLIIGGVVIVGALAMYGASSMATFRAPWEVQDPRGWSEGFATPYLAVQSRGAGFGAPLGVQRMLAYQLASESRGQAAASLGKPYGAPPWVAKSDASDALKNNEAYAAGVAYKRNLSGSAGSNWRTVGWTAASWRFGSGGLFGLLPANGLASIVRARPSVSEIAERKLSPWDVFDAHRGTALYIDMMRRTLKLGGVKTWVDFKAAAASISTLRNPQSVRYQAIVANVPRMMMRAGLPSTWALQTIDAESIAFLKAFKLTRENYDR